MSALEEPVAALLRLSCGESSMSCVISCRTWGGGEERRCPICQTRSWVEPSLTTGDAPCPSCGHLLWPVHHVRRAIAQGVRTRASAAYRLGRTVRAGAQRVRRAVTALTRSSRPKSTPPAPSPGGVWDPWLDA